MAKKNTRTESLEVPITLADHPFYGLKLDEQQKVFRDAIWDKDKLIVFCNAKAGTGKTLLATATANLLCQYGRCDGMIYIASPTQEQKQGYLKGTIEEKSEPYFEPFYEALGKIGVNRNTAFYDGGTNGKYQSAYIQCVTQMLGEVFGEQGSSDTVDDDQVATDAEVAEMLKEVFGL